MPRKGPAARISRVHTPHGKIEFVDIATLRVARIAAPERGVLFELAPPGSARGCITFILQISGTSTCAQQRRSVQLAPGQWDAFDAGPLHVTANRSAAEQIAFLLPQDQLDRKVDLEQLAVRRQPGATGISRLLCHAASILFQEIPKSSSSRVAELTEPVRRWLNIAVRERMEGEEAEGSPHERLRRRVKTYVNAHVRDPTLSVERIARQLSCTPRYLQKAFQSTGRRLSDQIRDVRLDRCYSDLLDPAQTHRSITEIALSWGFNSVTHFSDAFRQRFGVAPSIARRDRAS
jgi:AraC-like DNA-binding protein